MIYEIMAKVDLFPGVSLFCTISILSSLSVGF